LFRIAAGREQGAARLSLPYLACIAPQSEPRLRPINMQSPSPLPAPHRAGALAGAMPDQAARSCLSHG
jgi:hypothetical protein